MSLTAASWLQAGVLVLALAASYRPLGDYMAYVFTTDKHWRGERVLVKLHDHRHSPAHPGAPVPRRAAHNELRTRETRDDGKKLENMLVSSRLPSVMDGAASGRHAEPWDLAIEVSDLVKTYPVAGGGFTAVDQVSLDVARGEFVAILGRSGSGKTTLLNLLAGIDRPTSGTVRVAGAELGSLSESQLARWRGRNVGLVFQFSQLLSTLTVAENVMLAMDFAKVIPVGERAERTRRLLERVGVGDQADKVPGALSGSQQQRAAIARALANDPPVLLADKPTGNLDSQTARTVLDLFVELNADGQTIVVVTHERDVRAVAGRQVRLQDGKIVSNTRTSAAASALAGY